MTTVAVFGGYGFIGSACLKALERADFRVIGIGRSEISARRCNSRIEWRVHDIATTTAAEWSTILADVDVVVNAAGALQDGARDRVSDIHETAIARIVEGLRGRDVRFVQISAAGATEAASSEFFRSKARGDALLSQSDLDWVILRPVLVIGAQAYGGTALLRAAAAIPFCDFRVFEDSPMQTVSVDELADAVVQAATGAVPARTVFDMTEPGRRSLGETVRAFRTWLGFAQPRLSVPVPSVVLKAVAGLADMLGWLGWRSPLRSTALSALRDGVTGSDAAWRGTGGAAFASLEESLGRLPSTTQERWFARCYLMLPVAVATLALFWIASGVIGLVERDAAAAVLTDRGQDRAAAMMMVVAGGGIDIALGAAILVRRTARLACFGMIGTSLAYLLGAGILAPDLWRDPLGPMLKVLPGMVLALFAAAILDDR